MKPSTPMQTKFTYDQYVEDVISGRQVACKWVRLAVERHVRDLEQAQANGWRFDHEKARVAIAFFSLLKHSKGEWAGQTIRLEGWQQFITAMIFGWLKADGTRRFKNAYIEVARKNGKSTWAAGVGLYMLLADGEPGAEIYSAATKRDQARITHSEATRMAKASPNIRNIVRIFKDNIHIENTASKYEPLGSDTDSADGLNVHAAIVDELHAHKSRDMWDVLDTATSARRQPLMLAITTAGFDRNSICWELHTYTEQVLQGSVVDYDWFGIIYTLDKDPKDPEKTEDWDNEDCWIKANPNIGVSKRWDDMRSKARKAKEMPTALNNFLRKELNVWTQSITKWVNWEHWTACNGAADPVGLRGRTCYGGLDLSSNTDISALVLVFPPQQDGDEYQVLCRFFVPEDTARERTKQENMLYQNWIRQGYLTATAGNVIDYDFILEQIDEDAKTYDLQEIAYDRWGATKIAQAIQELAGRDDFLVQFGQGYASMSPPTKELERLILDHKLAHGNNPVLNWMADNLVVRTDPAGNIKPDKERSLEKIDGMVAMIMALDRALRRVDTDSVYESGGIKRL